MKIFEKLENKFGYLKFKSNWHKHPWLSNFLCDIGRHDYEGIDFNLKNKTINLQCFYCEKNKTTLLKKMPSV